MKAQPAHLTLADLGTLLVAPLWLIVMTVWAIGYLLVALWTVLRLTRVAKQLGLVLVCIGGLLLIYLAVQVVIVAIQESGR